MSDTLQLIQAAAIRKLRDTSTFRTRSKHGAERGRSVRIYLGVIVHEAVTSVRSDDDRVIDEAFQVGVRTVLRQSASASWTGHR